METVILPKWNLLICAICQIGSVKKRVFKMYSEVFASRLKQARKDYGLTQVQTANLLKIDKSTLAKYELGQREPSIEILVKMGLLFEVTLDWLCGLTSKDGTDHLKVIAEDRARNEILKKMERDAMLAQRLEAKAT
jgi:transcriptional regulator with XRE-family HTH domain